MPLTVGVRFGPYEVLSTLGAGGMGEVYRAREARPLVQSKFQEMNGRVSSDGRWLAMILVRPGSGASRPAQIQIIEHWLADLSRRVRADR